MLLPYHEEELMFMAFLPNEPSNRLCATAVLIQDNAMMVRVGLVDDDPSVRRATVRLLRSHGYSCTAYESGEQALADPALLKLDCLILDIQLAGITGFEIRDRLRNSGSGIPLFFITAHSEANLASWSSSMGNSPYLTKPFDEHRLIGMIEGLRKRG